MTLIRKGEEIHAQYVNFELITAHAIFLKIRTIRVYPW